MIRLPDPFTPGGVATAATPTCCCCCCCCCVVSSVGAAVALPAGLRHDTRENPRPSSLIIAPAGLFPLSVIVAPFIVGDVDFLPYYAVLGVIAAPIWAVVAGKIAKSPQPGLGVARLAAWIALFLGEFALGFFLVLQAAALGHFAWVVLGLYLVAAVATGVAVYRNYRDKQ